MLYHALCQYIQRRCQERESITSAVAEAQQVPVQVSHYVSRSLFVAFGQIDFNFAKSP